MSTFNEQHAQMYSYMGATLGSPGENTVVGPHTTQPPTPANGSGSPSLTPRPPMTPVLSVGPGGPGGPGIRQSPARNSPITQVPINQAQMGQGMPVNAPMPPQNMRMWGPGGPPPRGVPLHPEVQRARMTGRIPLMLDINVELLRHALSSKRQSRIFMECMKRLQINIAYLYILNDPIRMSQMPSLKQPILDPPPGVPSLAELYARLVSTFR